MNTGHSKKPYIFSPELTKIRDSFDQLIQVKEKFNTANCMLITGESGSGKSELAKYFVKQNPPYKDETGTKTPILHYEIKMANTPRDVLTGLLIAINDPQMGHGRNATELFNRFVQLTKTIKTKLIILDEVQVIIERRSEKVISGIGDLFKDLIKETEIPIVFMGMPWTKYLIQSNPQLNGRIASRHVMPSYRLTVPEQAKNFKAFYYHLAYAYDFPKEISEPTHEFLIRLFAFTKGNIRQLSRLIRDVFIISNTSSTKTDAKQFAKVIENYGYSDSINPFIQKITDIIVEENISESDFLFSARTKRNSIISAEIARYKVTKNLDFCHIL